MKDFINCIRHHFSRRIEVIPLGNLSDFVRSLNIPRTPSQQRPLINEQDFDQTISTSSVHQHQLSILSFPSAPPSLAHVPAHGALSHVGSASDSSAHVTLALSPITLLPTTPQLIGKNIFFLNPHRSSSMISRLLWMQSRTLIDTVPGRNLVIYQSNN